MIQIPVSEKTPVAAGPRNGVPDFHFSVRNSGGMTLGNGIREFDWTLEVDSRLGLASLEAFAPDGRESKPIGVFRRTIGDDELREFHQLAAGANLGALRPAMKEHPAYTERRYFFR
jgi:hypothetical protein